MLSRARVRPPRASAAAAVVRYPSKMEGRRKGCGRQKPRKPARLEGSEGFPTCLPHMRVRAGACAHVPFYTVNPSDPSIMICKSYQVYRNKQFYNGRVEASTLTLPFQSWKGSASERSPNAMLAQFPPFWRVRSRLAGSEAGNRIKPLDHLKAYTLETSVSAAPAAATDAICMPVHAGTFASATDARQRLNGVRACHRCPEPLLK